MLSNKIGSCRFIGIDGGGTKTDLMIGDEHGNLLARCGGGSGNVKSRSREEVQQMLLELIQEGLRQSESEPAQLASIMLGLAGGYRPDDKRKIIEFLRPHLPSGARIEIQTDAAAALAAGSFGEAGIVLISGTGSIAFGHIPETGEAIRVGGWGYLLGDEGSGYQMGQKSLQAVLHAHDGRGESTRLTSDILEQLALRSPEQFIDAFYENPNMRKEIADLSKLAIEAAQQGDGVAQRIVNECIGDLARMVFSAERKFSNLDGFFRLNQVDGFPLVLAGGLFRSEYFTQQVINALEVERGQLAKRVIPLRYPPVWGAYLLALLGTGRKLTEAMKQQLEQSWMT